MLENPTDWSDCAWIERAVIHSYDQFKGEKIGDQREGPGVRDSYGVGPCDTPIHLASGVQHGELHETRVNQTRPEREWEARQQAVAWW